MAEQNLNWNWCWPQIGLFKSTKKLCYKKVIIVKQKLYKFKKKSEIFNQSNLKSPPNSPHCPKFDSISTPFSTPDNLKNCSKISSQLSAWSSFSVPRNYIQFTLKANWKKKTFCHSAEGEKYHWTLRAQPIIFSN